MKTRIKKYIDKNFNLLAGKNIFITGATGEIGQAIIEILLYLKANVIVGYRDLLKANSLKRKYPNVELFDLDLSNIKSIINSIDIINNMNVDFMIHNAGVASGDLTLNQLVNLLSPYYLINSLKSVSHIIVGSISYKKNDEKDYYSISKKMLMQACYNLNDQGYDIRLTHPGIVDTILFRQRNKGILVNLIRPFMNKPIASALSIVSGIYIKPDSNEWIGPKGLCESFGYPRVSKLNKKLFNNEELNNVKKFINCQMEEKYGF